MANKELEYLESIFEIRNEKEQQDLETWILSLGYDKCIEIYQNYNRIVSTNKKIDVKEIITFTNYEYSLSTFLFTVLRGQEDNVKAYLANVNHDVSLEIESRPSNFSKTKYYFLFPTSAKNKPLYIRTFNYTRGPVKYYDAIKTLDFGDVNLIFSHLPPNLIKEFSNNKDIVSDLDKTRKLRNYVYHHNLLFSFGKDKLVELIVLLLKNLPTDDSKKMYINILNNMKNIDKDLFDINPKVYIYLGDKETKAIYSQKAILGDLSKK